MIRASNSAPVRMANLPIVRFAWSQLSMLYTETKSSHSHLKVICNAVEDQAVSMCTVALDAVSPILLKLGPQMSAANGLACRSLDWLESTFPLLQAPVEKDKINQVYEMVCINAVGVISCIQHTVGHAVDKLLHIDCHSSPVLEGALTAAEAGLDKALSFSEALVDSMFPPAEKEDKEEANSVQGFDSRSLRTSPERLSSVCTKLCRRTYKAIEKLLRSPHQAQILQDYLPTFISSLPQHLQHQAVTTILFISQMYTLRCSSTSQVSTEGTCLFITARLSPTHKDLLKGQWQESPTWRVKLNEAADCGCKSCAACQEGCDAKSCTSP